MKIGIVSDLHLDAGYIRPPIDWSGDVLIMAGDVAEHKFCLGFPDKLEKLAECASRVFWIPGNHEYYMGDINKVDDELRELVTRWPHMEVINREARDLTEGWKLYGATFWTDFGNDPMAMCDAGFRMADYKYIRNGDRDFRPGDAIDLFKESVQGLENALQEHPDDDFFVVGHHAPHYDSIIGKYRAGPYHSLNLAYYTDMTKYLSNPRIKVWAHGHVHNKADYEIEGCRVVCNPRGYVGYEIPKFSPLEVLTLEI